MANLQVVLPRAGIVGVTRDDDMDIRVVLHGVTQFPQAGLGLFIA